MNTENNQLVLISISNLEEVVRKIIRTEIEDFSNKITRVPKTLTRDEAAMKMNVNPNTISNYVRQGRLKNRGIGRRILLHDTDIESITTNRLKYRNNW